MDTAWLWRPVWKCFRGRIWGFLPSQGVLTQAWRVIVAPVPPHPDGRMDGWLGERRRRRWCKREVHLLPGMWRVLANYFLCVLTTVLLLPNTSSVWWKKTRDIPCDVNEPRRSRFSSPLYTMHLKPCGCYSNAFENIFTFHANLPQRFLLFISLSKLESQFLKSIFSDPFFVFLHGWEWRKWDHMSPFCSLIINKTLVYGHAILDCQRHAQQTVNTQRPPLEVRNDSKWLKITRNGSK